MNNSYKKLILDEKYRGEFLKYLDVTICNLKKYGFVEQMRHYCTARDKIKTELRLLDINT